MKIGIIGSRHFKDQEKAKIFTKQLIFYLDKEIEIVSGGCKEGVDSWVKEEYENGRFLYYKEFPPEFSRYPIPLCYHVRNNQIINYSDIVIAIWNGDPVHSGTYSVIMNCKRKNKPILIFVFK